MKKHKNTYPLKKEPIGKSLLPALFVVFIIQACTFGPTTQEVTLTYLVKDNNLYYNREDGSSLLGVNPKLTVYTTVTNTSDYGGVFKFYAEISSQGNQVTFADEQFLASGQTVTFSETKEINHYSFKANVTVDRWGIVPPTKVITIK